MEKGHLIQLIGLLGTVGILAKAKAKAHFRLHGIR
jgi:hypothetical protein